MSWDAMDAIAEVVGAAAVIASLLYVALQIRHNTQGTRIATFQSAVRGVQDFNRVLTTDPELLRVYFEGHKNFEQLSPEDCMRFHGLMMNWVLEYQLFSHAFAEGAQTGESFAGRSLGEFEKNVISMLRTRGDRRGGTGRPTSTPKLGTS